MDGQEDQVTRYYVDTIGLSDVVVWRRVGSGRVEYCSGAEQLWKPSEGFAFAAFLVDAVTCDSLREIHYDELPCFARCDYRYRYFRSDWNFGLRLCVKRDAARAPWQLHGSIERCSLDVTTHDQQGWTPSAHSSLTTVESNVSLGVLAEVSSEAAIHEEPQPPGLKYRYYEEARRDGQDHLTSVSRLVWRCREMSSPIGTYLEGLVEVRREPACSSADVEWRPSSFDSPSHLTAAVSRGELRERVRVSVSQPYVAQLDSTPGHGVGGTFTTCADLAAVDRNTSHYFVLRGADVRSDGCQQCWRVLPGHGPEVSSDGGRSWRPSQMRSLHEVRARCEAFRRHADTAVLMRAATALESAKIAMRSFAPAAQADAPPVRLFAHVSEPNRLRWIVCGAPHGCVLYFSDSLQRWTQTQHTGKSFAEMHLDIATVVEITPDVPETSGRQR